MFGRQRVAASDEDRKYYYPNEGARSALADPVFFYRLALSVSSNAEAETLGGDLDGEGEQTL